MKIVYSIRNSGDCGTMGAVSSSQLYLLVIGFVCIALSNVFTLPATSSPSPTQQLSLPISQHNGEDYSESEQTNTGCVDGEKKAEHKHLTAKEEMQLRIELFKLKILQKINLKEAPNVSKSLHEFPKVPLNNFKKTIVTVNDKPVENNAQKGQSVESAAILADKISSDLVFGALSSIVTFKLKTSTLRSYDEVVKAQVWIFIKPTTLRHNYGIRVSTDIDGNVVYADVLDSPTTNDWVSVDLTEQMHRWILRVNEGIDNMTENVEYTVYLDVPTISLGFTKDERPTLIISGRQQVKKRESRSTASCSDDTSQCCVQPLTVTFSEIGWDEWIMAPDSFSVNYCKGHCDDSNSALYNSTLALMGYARHTPNSLQLNSCCVPSVLKPLQVIYQSDATDVSGAPVFVDIIMDDMIIEECGCM
ncbi:growth/differentiation factor 8-like [Anneissia japonica]|uniref:growth/differentiation factor 8-like n=1 Tax=Anneissia japonica TaxID=1529436 RepID=UPI00142554CA|nr:growth/differentiation factor 8-like [Anneissia japonica]